MTHNLNNVQAVAHNYAKLLNPPSTKKGAQKRKHPDSGVHTERVNTPQPDAATPAPVASPQSPTIPHTPQASTMAHAWQLKQARAGLPGQGAESSVTQGYRPLPSAQELLNRPQQAQAAPVASAPQLHSPVAPVSQMKPVAQTGFSQKNYNIRRTMPTASDLLNGRQQAKAAPVSTPKMPKPIGPAIDLSGYDQPSL